jgi:hypothetical protein
MTTYATLKQAFLKIHRNHYALADVRIKEKTKLLNQAKQVLYQMDDYYANDLKVVQIPRALNNDVIKIDTSRFLPFGFKWFSDDNRLSLIHTNMRLGHYALSYCRFQSLDELTNYYTSPPLKKFGVVIEIMPSNYHTLPPPLSLTYPTIKNKIEDTCDSNLHCERLFQCMTPKEMQLRQSDFLKLYHQRK